MKYMFLYNIGLYFSFIYLLHLPSPTKNFPNPSSTLKPNNDLSNPISSNQIRPTIHKRADAFGRIEELLQSRLLQYSPESESY